MTEIKLPSVDTTEGSQSAYSPSSPLIRRRSCTSFGLPGEWQVCSDRPLCRRLGNSQAATLLQSNILLKTCHYRDKISTCYCCAVSVPFQRLYKAFLRYWELQNRTHANHITPTTTPAWKRCRDFPLPSLPLRKGASGAPLTATPPTPRGSVWMIPCGRGRLRVWRSSFRILTSRRTTLR